MQYCFSQWVLLLEPLSLKGWFIISAWPDSMFSLQISSKIWAFWYDFHGISWVSCLQHKGSKSQRFRLSSGIQSEENLLPVFHSEHLESLQLLPFPWCGCLGRLLWKLGMVGIDSIHGFDGSMTRLAEASKAARLGQIGFGSCSGWSCRWEDKEYQWLVGGLEHQFYFPINIGLLIIPIDFHIFQRGSNHQPDEYLHHFASYLLSTTFHQVIEARRLVSRIFRDFPGVLEFRLVRSFRARVSQRDIFHETTDPVGQQHRFAIM